MTIYMFFLLFSLHPFLGRLSALSFLVDKHRQYLYYSQKLVQATAIERIVVWEQGRGHINNLGALRTKPLREWGHLYDPDTHQVFQWPVDEQGDRVLSPVVHQWDRDKDLHGWMVRTKHKQWEQEWMQQQQQQQ